MKSETRLDVYLWAIRIFKTRSITNDAIKKGKVKLNKKNIKPSRLVKIGELYEITISSNQTKTIEVAELINKRGSFEAVKKYYIDHSPPIDKIVKQEKTFFSMSVKQDKGSGRPTKKNRRNLSKEGGWF